MIHQGHLVADGTLDQLKRQITGGAVSIRLAEAAPADGLRTLEGVAEVSCGEALELGQELRVRPAAGVDDLEARLFQWAAEEGRVLKMEEKVAYSALDKLEHRLAAQPVAAVEPAGERVVAASKGAGGAVAAAAGGARAAI